MPCGMTGLGACPQFSLGLCVAAGLGVCASVRFLLAPCSTSAGVREAALRGSMAKVV